MAILAHLLEIYTDEFTCEMIWYLGLALKLFSDNTQIKCGKVNEIKNLDNFEAWWWVHGRSFVLVSSFVCISN